MGVITAWIAEMLIITARDVKKGASNNVAGFPLPADYLASFAIFGVLGALPNSASTFAGVTAWGFVIATFLNFVDPTLGAQNQANGTAPVSIKGAAGPSPVPASIPTQSVIA